LLRLNAGRRLARIDDDRAINESPLPPLNKPARPFGLNKSKMLMEVGAA
jgi:hypothetical protein